MGRDPLKKRDASAASDVMKTRPLGMAALFSLTVFDERDLAVASRNLPGAPDASPPIGSEPGGGRSPYPWARDQAENASAVR